MYYYIKIKNIKVSVLEIEIQLTLTNYFAEYTFIQTTLKGKHGSKPPF